MLKFILNVFSTALVFALAVLALSVHNYWIGIPSLIVLFFMSYKMHKDLYKDLWS